MLQKVYSEIRKEKNFNVMLETKFTGVEAKKMAFMSLLKVNKAPAEQYVRIKY